jgi:hypothetical protein
METPEGGTGQSFVPHMTRTDITDITRIIITRRLSKFEFALVLMTGIVIEEGIDVVRQLIQDTITPEQVLINTICQNPGVLMTATELAKTSTQTEGDVSPIDQTELETMTSTIQDLIASSTLCNEQMTSNSAF